MPLALPADESARLRVLNDLDLRDGESASVFDTITRLLATALDVPMAALTLIDERAQRFVSRVGFEAESVAREHTLCTRTITLQTPLVVEDIHADPSLDDHLLRRVAPALRAYAGQAVRTRDGHAIGTLCVLDTRPRSFDARQIAQLVDLAALAGHEVRRRETVSRSRQLTTASLDAFTRSQSLYLAIFEHAAVGITIVSLEGQWLRVNPTLCRILARPAEQLAQLTFQDLTHPDDLDADLALAAQLQAGERTHYTMEKRFLRPDASVVWTHMTVTLLRDGQGQPQSFVTILEDITTRRAQQHSLQLMQSRLADRVAERTRELREANEALEDLYHHAPCGYYSLDPNGRFARINAHALTLYATTADTMIGRRGPADFFDLAGRRRFAETFPIFKRVGQFGPEEFDLHADDGQVRRVRVTATAQHDDRGAFVRSRTVIIDVTELHRTRLALQAVNRQQHLMLDNDLFAIIKVRDRRFVWVNRAFEALVGYASDELIGQPTALMYASAAEHARIGQETQRLLTAGRACRTELAMRHRDGRMLWIDLHGTLLSEEGAESIWMLRDITATRQQREQVESLAYHDPLTGLPNRRWLLERLTKALAVPDRAADSLAVAFIDLDGFKRVNDLHGHDAGDRVLTQIGARLAASLRAQDLLARLGGDEFVLVLTGLADRQRLDAALERWVGLIEQPVELGTGIRVRVGASVGIAWADAGTTDARTLIAAADAAMYRAKRGGG